MLGKKDSLEKEFKQKMFAGMIHSMSLMHLTELYLKLRCKKLSVEDMFNGDYKDLPVQDMLKNEISKRSEDLF